MIRYLILWFSAVLTLAAPAAASKVHSKPPPSLNSAKAYVVAEIGKLDDAMIHGSLVLGRYDSAKSDIAEPTPPPGGKIPHGGWVRDNRVHLLKPAMRHKERRLYIAELDPGLWVVEGANDTAFSLGSSAVQLDAGTVIDLGVVSVYSDFPPGEKRDVLTAGRLLKGALLGGVFGRVIPASIPKAIDVRARQASDMPLPPLLAHAKPVVWTGEVRFGNHLGGLVNRMGGRKARLRALAAEQAKATVEQPTTGLDRDRQAGSSSDEVVTSAQP